MIDRLLRRIGLARLWRLELAEINRKRINERNCALFEELDRTSAERDQYKEWLSAEMADRYIKEENRLVRSRRRKVAA